MSRLLKNHTAISADSSDVLFSLFSGLMSDETREDENTRRRKNGGQRREESEDRRDGDGDEQGRERNGRKKHQRAGGDVYKQKITKTVSTTS